MRCLLEAIKPEVMYFTDSGVGRGAVMIVELDSASQAPHVTEPLQPSRLLAANLPGDTLKTRLVRHRAMGGELVDNGRELLSGRPRKFVGG